MRSPSKWLRGALAGGLLVILATFFLSRDGSPIVFESMESKTVQGGPVFNRVKWIPGRDQEMWVMQQSHRGLSGSPESWDRLAIVVDKTTTPKIARFYQLKPGGSEAAELAERIPFKVGCGLCHLNGPRGIRPNLESPALRVSLWDRARLALMNLRIKTYGRVLARDEPGIRFTDAHSNEKLEVASCTRCHNEKPWGRGTLTRQNFLSIEFMLRNRFMPPPGFSLSEDDQSEIRRFLRAP